MIVVEVDELQSVILNEVGSARWEKSLAGYSNEFKAGVMWGMSWAGLLTTECNQYNCVKENE